MSKLNVIEMRVTALLKKSPSKLTGDLREYLLDCFNERCSSKPDRERLVAQALENACFAWQKLDAKDRPKEIDAFRDFGLRQLLDLLLPPNPESIDDLKKIAQKAMKTEIVFPYVHVTVGRMNYRRTAEQTWTSKSQIRVRVIQALEKFIDALRLKKSPLDEIAMRPRRWISRH